MLNDIFTYRDCKTGRISSYDRTGANQDFIIIQPGEHKAIAEIQGAGIIKHIWITINSSDPMFRRNIILRMYWDNEEEPSVESPIGDFFGQGWGENYNFISLPIAAAPAQGKAFNCYFPMPFGKGSRIEIENQSELAIDAFFFNIDYEMHKEISPEAGRFHAWWNREITAPEEDMENEWATFGPDYTNCDNKGNYLYADIQGKGSFVGINYYVENPGPMWYGEGDDMWMIDGEVWPGSLHGTGTEDFFNCSWCPTEIYQHPYFGYARVTNKLGWMGRTHCYRFFIQDPIYFASSLHASIEHGHANNLTLDIATVAYWYQQEPHKPFPVIPAKADRQNMPEVWVTDIHRWRNAWRKSMGGGRLWGNEKNKE